MVKKIAGLFVIGLILTGCSKTDELTDQAASNIVDRVKTPIEQARAVSEKAAATRGAEMPK